MRRSSRHRWTTHLHRVASVVFLIVVTLIVRDVSFIFLFVLFLVWLFPKKDISSCRAIRIVCVEALGTYSAHVHMLLSGDSAMRYASSCCDETSVGNLLMDISPKRFDCFYLSIIGILTSFALDQE